MKNALYLSIVLICSLLSVGCRSLLELDPQSSLTSEKFWKSEADVENGVTAMYYSLSQAMARGYYDWGELRGGNYTGDQPNGPDQYDIINNIMTSANSAGLWTNLYQTISRANLVLKYAPNVNMLSSQKNGYLAECYAIRALCYFYIIRVWGDAPLFLTPVEEYDPDNIYRERSDKELILDQIAADLELAEMYAQPVTSGSFKRTRINQMAVYALMADVYAWRHQYDKVLAVMEKVYRLAPETSSNAYWQTLELSPNVSQEEFTEAWQEIFARVDPDGALTDIPKERIFYIHYEEIENGLNGNTSYFCTGACKAYPSERLLSMYASGDKRLAATYTGSSEKKLTAKFWGTITSFGSGGQVSNCDLILYRMSDLVLLHAEALARTGDLNGAVVELNKIHTRAGLPAYLVGDFIAPDDVVRAVLDERTIELIGEGKFWFDLLRTDHAADIGGITDPNKYLFPINKTHLDENYKLKQNPGYGAGE